MLYAAWAAVAVCIVLIKDGLTPDNATHLAILAYLASSAFAIPLLQRLAERYPPQKVFLGFSLISAAAVEVCYMITAPLHPSLLIDADTKATHAFRNVGVDLALTLPAYVLIFAVILILIRRYDYRPIEFTVLTSAGQAIGDGMSFLAANPTMLIFLPYLMLNYHAMTLVPYVALRGRLQSGQARRGPMMLVLPLIVLPLLYGVVGTAIILLGRTLRWIE